MIRKKRTNRAKLVEKLDKIITLILRQKEPVCVVCGSDKQLGNGHIFTRKALSTRWDITDDGNCHIQCWACNFRHVRDQYPYFKWYTDKFGQEAFEELRRRHKTILKVNDNQLQEILDSLTSLSKNF